MNKVMVIGIRRPTPEGYTRIDTTSRSKKWGPGLSPFYAGKDMDLYGDYKASNLENAWQFSKLYKEYADSDGNPTEDYFKWAEEGWNDTSAHRYPMGKGARPLCSVWDGEKLDYINSRAKIYLPLYAREVVKSDKYKELKEMYDRGEKIALADFDGYDYITLGCSFRDVLTNPKKKMGHAFVLAMLLEGAISIEDGVLKCDTEKLTMRFRRV